MVVLQEVKASDGMDAILAAMHECALDSDGHMQCQAGAAIDQLTDQDEMMRVCCNLVTAAAKECQSLSDG